jgi:hypothetical protein
MITFSDTFLINNYLKTEGGLSPLIYNFALECAISLVQTNRKGLKLNGTHQILFYADDVNIYSGRI